MQERNEKNVEVNLYQYAPTPLVNSAFDLKAFDFRKWFDGEFSEKGFKIAYRKVDNPLELSLLGSVEDTFYSCVEKHFSPSPRISGDTFHQEGRVPLASVIPSGEPVLTCSTCKAAFTKAETLKEHLRGHERGLV